MDRRTQEILLIFIFFQSKIFHIEIIKRKTILN